MSVSNHAKANTMTESPSRRLVSAKKKKLSCYHFYYKTCVKAEHVSSRLQNAMSFDQYDQCANGKMDVK